MTKLQTDIIQKASELLEQHALRKTSCRLNVLTMLLENQCALAHSDIETQLGKKYDRVTLYRTLHSFEEKGLVHSIHDMTGAIKYALCQEKTHQDKPYRDNHAHFNCTACGQTFCLNEIRIPSLPFPKGYQVQRLHYSAQGVCSTCDKAQ